MPQRRRSPTRTLHSILKVDGSRSKDALRARYIVPLGLNHALVQFLGCEAKILVSVDSPGITPEPGTTVTVIAPEGGRAFTALVAPALGGGGSFVTQQQEETVPAPATDEYYGLVFDPTVADLLHVHRYGIGGAYLGELRTIDFSAATLPPTDAGLVSAIQIKDVAGVPDGFALVTGSSRPIQVTLVNLTTGSVIQTGLADLGATVGTGFLHLDPSGPYLFAGAGKDTFPSPDEIRLYRTTLPTLSDTQEIDFLVEPLPARYLGSSAVWLPDRVRVPRTTSNVPDGLDHIFLDPAAAPQQGATTDLLVTGGVRKSPRPLGHDGVSKAWFGWDGPSDEVKIWELPASGDGSDFGMPETYTEDLSMQLRYTGTFPDDFWWTFYRVYETSSQSAAAINERRIARVQFSGSVVTLPTPVFLDIEAAEADQGWAPGEGVPTSILPWFP